MNTLSSHSISKGRSFKWNFWLINLALVICLLLSVLSWFELCVQHCSANQDFRLFGMPFAIVGITFFAVCLSLHCLSNRYLYLSRFVGWLIASALGAEIMFIIIQKYQIGHWCPVCLSIAFSLATAGLILLIGYLKNFKLSIQHHNRGEIMNKIKQGLSSVVFIFMGFLMAFIGISKPNEAEAAVNEIKERIVFGTKSSPIHVYFITDWFCPSCRKIEPLIEKIYPEIQSKVAFYFIDFPIHRKSLNFTPYNLAFLVNDKNHYFEARDILSDLSEKSESPDDEEVTKLAKKQGITYKELSFLDVRAGIDFFDTIVDKYDIRATPTIIITNTKNNKVVKLEGRDEITESKVLEAIDKVKK